jgi:hypothetical protein
MNAYLGVGMLRQVYISHSHRFFPSERAGFEEMLIS